MLLFVMEWIVSDSFLEEKELGVITINREDDGVSTVYGYQEGFI